MFNENFLFTKHELRTRENHNDFLDYSLQNSLTNYKGIKFNSIFNELKYFHVCENGLPPCIGHDIFEGVVAYDMFLFAIEFMSEFSLSVEFINKRLNEFKYSTADSKDKPCEINIKNKRLCGHAIQNWNFLRLFPVIFKDYFDKDSQICKIIVLLHKVVELICAPRITHNQIFYMNDIIEDYLESRKNMFSSVPLRAKHHFMLHYACLTMRFGPLIRLWTMRFESKHSYFRQSAQHGRNFVNITKSLAERHQLLQAYLATGPIYQELILESVATAFQVYLFDLKVQNCILDSLGELHKNALYSEKVLFRGIEYKQNMFIVISRLEKNLIFGKLLFMLIVNNDIYFVIKMLVSHLCAQTNLYFINPNQKEEFKCIPNSDILDYYPLHGYMNFSNIIIPLKHAIIDNFV